MPAEKRREWIEIIYLITRVLWFTIAGQSLLTNWCVGGVGMCYYGDWAAYRRSPAGLIASEIDVSLCSHVIYAFFQVSHDFELKEYDPAYRTNLATLRAKSSNLKILIAVGGWNHGHRKFYDMAIAPNGTEIFAESTVSLLKRLSLDGLDVDWEYPHNQKPQFSKLIKSLRSAFNAERRRGGKKLILTAAVTANRHYAPLYYNFNVLQNNIDYVLLMTYDLSGPWDPSTGHQSALSGNAHGYDVTSVVEFYTSRGISREKIIVGFPTYGRTFRLSTQSTRVGSPSIGGVAGYFTKEEGMMAYYEICSQYLSYGATYKWDSRAKASYIHKGSVWVSFDSKQALCHKMKWINGQHIGGWMVWTIDLDDHANICSEGRYPLIGFLKEHFGRNMYGVNCDSDEFKPNPVRNPVIPSVMVATLPTGGTHSLTTPSIDDRHCIGKDDGFYWIDNNCKSFVRCYRSNTYPQVCRGVLLFNHILKVCDWPQNVDCGRGEVTRSTSTRLSTSTYKSTSSKSTSPSKSTSSTKSTSYKMTPQTTNNIFTTSAATSFSKTFCKGKPVGNYPHPQDCRAFIQCTDSGSHKTDCPGGLLYNNRNKRCDWPWNVICGQRGSSATAKLTTTQRPSSTSTTAATTPIRPKTESTTTSSTSTPTTIPTEVNFCAGRPNGFHPNPDDCFSFIQCSHNIRYTFRCPLSLAFNVNIKACDWLINVDCHKTTGTGQSKTSHSTTSVSNTPSTASAATPMSSTTKLSQDNFCQGKRTGYYPNVEDGCKTFYRCVFSMTYKFPCGRGLLFDDVTKTCDFSSKVTCS